MLPTTLLSLPPEEVDRLKTLRASKDPSDLYARTAALFNLGWPMRAVAEPFGLSRATTTGWKDKADLSAARQVTDIPALPSARRYVPMPLVTTIPAPTAAYMRELSKHARKVRAGTPVTSPAREAAAKLDALIDTAVSERGVSMSEVGRCIGLTHYAISLRLSKYKSKDNS